jgi:dinuclear metal center YbgI/SA1388 family protein
MPIPLATIVSFLDEIFQNSSLPDYPSAYNGLQVENRRGRVKQVAVAVDASEAVLQKAVKEGADLLVVHHGLLWSGLLPVTGANFRKLRLCLENDLAVISCHLPLDAHDTYGNNALLLKALGLPAGEPCLPYEGLPVGRRVKGEWSRKGLAENLGKVLGARPHLAPGGPEVVRDLVVCTGGAGSSVTKVAALGADTFITGEGTHATFSMAEELGVNLFYGGHYATETFGVKAIGALLYEKFGLPWEFLDHPTGL